MPLLPGISFATRYVIQGRVRDGRLCRDAPAIDALGDQLAPILDGAHAHGLVHGYLCARDVLLLRGRVILAGTGLWRMFDRHALADTLIGELGLAPEARSGLPTTPAADVYSMAALCAQL